MKKTCCRHYKRKRPLEFDDWQTTIEQLETWAKAVSSMDCQNFVRTRTNKYVFQTSNEPIDIKREYSLDSLPVSVPARLEDGSERLHPLTHALEDLTKGLGNSTCHKWYRRTGEQKGQLYVYTYYCCQDKDHSPMDISRKLKDMRDRGETERFHCTSTLVFRLCLVDRTLKMRMNHVYHEPYVDISLSEQVLDFISERTKTCTPAELYRALRDSDVPGKDEAMDHQVFYQWQLANRKLWRRDDDQILSALRLLEEYPNTVSTKIFQDGDMRGVALYMSDAIARLATRTKEVSMDATYGTNNAGMDLYAVLGELDGAGAPLAYLLVEVEKDQNGDRKATPGSTIAILQQFLGVLRDLDVQPELVGTDKDASEIFAVGVIWPQAKLQLCFWHVLRALKTKMNSSVRTITQSHYHPEGAVQLIPGLEICWGSELGRRPPNSEHSNGTCRCPSKSVEFARQGRLEPDVKEREEVVQIFKKHFNMHLLIPTDGVYRSSQEIQKFFARETYSWCREKGYYRLWAYLWTNWYQPQHWKTWARAAEEKQIPSLKTTMILESHWRKIKHDYLHRFNRPRIDLVVWVLLSKLIPDCLQHMNSIEMGDTRRGIASWRKDFKSLWNQNAKKEVRNESMETYQTDPIKRVCGCPDFLLSRFLLCKHLVHCFKEAPRQCRYKLFNDIKRHRYPPFWTSPYLELRPEYREFVDDEVQLHEDCDDMSISEAFRPQDESVAAPAEETEDEPEDDYEQVVTEMKDMVETMQKGKTAYTERLAELWRKKFRPAWQDKRDIERARRMPKTWARRRFSGSMFYQQQN